MQYSSPSLNSSFISPPQASPLPLNDRKSCKKIISELQNGRKAATELHHHFLAARDHHVSTMEELQVSAAELLARIISSFICCLTVFPDMADHQGKEQEGKPERSISKNIEKKQTAGSKKKRKFTEETKVTETRDLTNDGHAWRKYGRKQIKCSPHPRDYYKCTHWEDELCQARKWVQKVSDQPSIYRTTYDKEHTCKTASHLTVSAGHGFSSLVDQSDSCTYLSFGGRSNHPSTITGAVTVDCQVDHDYSVLQSNSLFFGIPPPPSSSSLSIMLQDIVALNNSGSLQQTTKSHDMATAETTSEEDTTDLKQIVEMPTNPYDISEIQSSSHHIISDLAPINMGDQDRYYVGDVRSEAFLCPTTSSCNYMTMQEDAMGHDHAFDSTVMDMYLGNVF